MCAYLAYTSLYQISREVVLQIDSPLSYNVKEYRYVLQIQDK